MDMCWLLYSKGSFRLSFSFPELVPQTHPEELGSRLVDGYYDDTVPPGQLCQQHHDLIGRHAVQACSRLVQ